MRQSNLVAFAAAAVIGFSLASCQCGRNNNHGNDGGGDLPDGGLCVAAGLACEADRPCCGGGCVNGLCTSSTFCKESGQLCGSNTDCCSNSCIGGTCSANACRQIGAACDVAEECC